MYDIPPHDPSLLQISEYELSMYIDGWLEVNLIRSGKKKPGPSSNFLKIVEERMKRHKKKLEESQNEKKESQELTPDEALRWLDNAGNQRHDERGS